MYLPESSIITTRDGLHLQVYMSTHPKGVVIAKPKYIPTDKIQSKALPYRYISGRKMNRLNMWIKPKDLKSYIEKFKKAYPEYIYWSDAHDTWFFAVPEERIEKVYDPRTGLAELMKMPAGHLDPHLKNVVEFVKFLKKSGVPQKDLGITYSTLAGHYYLGVSDINLVVYGAKNNEKVIKFLGKAKHPQLRWKTDKEWVGYHKRRGREFLMSDEEFLFHARRKKSEGFWGGNLFLVFGVEKPEEVRREWGRAKYESLGTATVRGIVSSDKGTGFRPGYYVIRNGEVVRAGNRKMEKLPVSAIVFYSRNFILQAKKGERVEARGLLEKVTPKNGHKFYRIVIGYFDAYLNGRHGEEYIKTIRA